ncbi:MAG: PAS domain S-box protein [Methanosarcina sp.]|jgi:PAS domain S-box-containing protein
MKEFQEGSENSFYNGIEVVTTSSQDTGPKLSENSKINSMSQDNYNFIIEILNTMLNPVAYKDMNGIYLGVNEIYARQIAGLSEEEIVGYTLIEVGKKVAERFPDRSFVNGRALMEHVKEWDGDDAELFKHGGTSIHEYEGICADGIKREFLVNKSTFCNENGEILGIVTVLQDITEHNKAKRSLEENEERYRITTEQTGQLIYDFDIKAGKINWAGAIEEITGYTAEEFKSIHGTAWLENIHPEDLKPAKKRVNALLKKGGKLNQEFKFRKKDGNYIYVEESGVCLVDESGKPYRILGVITDITEKKLSQQKVQQSEERYRSFIENFKGIAFQADENFIPQFLHGALVEITGYTEEEFMSELTWKDVIDPEYLPAIIEEEIKLREAPDVSIVEVEYRIRSKKGDIKWVHETCQKIPGKDGKPEVYQGVIYDITERKKAEESLEHIETARKKEIHHRIKNNLQVISSLLDLQAEKFCNRGSVKDSEVLEAFRESQNRVISIALIHEELHEGGGTDALNFSPYLERLVDNLFQTYRLGNANITLKKDLEKDIFFDMDIAVPLGLIVNELVSNSLKHAFSGRDRGEIRIKLCREKDIENEKGSCVENGTQNCKGTRFILMVSDDGTGIPDTVEIENSDSLGLQLVSILAAQLDSELEVKKDKGTEFIIGISIAEKA